MSINTRLAKLEKQILPADETRNIEVIFCNDGETIEQATERLGIDVDDGKFRIAVIFE